MLGAFLRVCEQLLLVCQVLGVCRTALYRACYRAVYYRSTVHRYEHFGGSARIGIIKTAEIEQVRAGICSSQHTVYVKAVGRVVYLETLRGNYLEYIAAADIFLGFLDVCHVLLLRDVRVYLHVNVGVLAVAANLRSVVLEYIYYLAHLFLALGVLLVKVVVSRDVQRDYRLVAQVIVGYQLVVVEKLRVRKSQVVIGGIRQRLFVVPYHIVGKVPHETARELGSAGYLG